MALLVLALCLLVARPWAPPGHQTVWSLAGRVPDPVVKVRALAATPGGSETRFSGTVLTFSVRFATLFLGILRPTVGRPSPVRS